jgi:hypothetical protein
MERELFSGEVAMGRVILTVGVLSQLSLAAFADVGKEEIKKLAQAGLSDDLILNYVRFKAPLARLSADDVVDLKKAGLNDSLLANLMPLQETGVEGKAVPKSGLASTDAAMAKLLSDPSVVYDGRAFYPRSYFSSDHAAYCSPAIGAAVVNPGWYATSALRSSACIGWSYGRGSFVRTGFGFGSSRNCYR